MPERVKGILVEGMVDTITFQANGSPFFMVIDLIGGKHHVGLKGLHHVVGADRFRAVCLAEPDQDGIHEAVDFIHNDNRNPISDAQRADQAKRVGLEPLYDSPHGIVCEQVIGKLTEIEQELIAYLVKHPELMQEMHSDAFEKLVAELLAANSFDVEWTGRNKNTAGDVLAFRADGALGLTESYIVECKRFKKGRPVGIEVARALYGAKTVERFSNALLVTSSQFQNGVEKFAMGRWDFQIKDYNGLVEWLNRYRPRRDGRLHMQERRIVRDGPARHL